jgi:hypothetical protein
MLIIIARPVIIAFATAVTTVMTRCPNDKKHTYEFCNGYSLGYANKWNSLAGETTTQLQTQSQAQSGSNVRIDGSHNNVVIEPRQTQDQAASSSSDSDGGKYGK